MSSEATWSVYLIRAGDDSLYCGVSIDVERRFEEHRSQGPKCARYLRGRIPLTLVFQSEVGSRSEALREEIRIKKLSRSKKEKLI